MSLVAVRDELAKRLATLNGLRVYSVPPRADEQAALQLPAAIIQPGQPLAEYDLTLAGKDVLYNFAVLVLTGSADPEQAWDELAGYLSPAGAGSFKAAVEGGSGGGADWFRVGQATEGGKVGYGKGGCWGVTFQVRAGVTAK